MGIKVKRLNALTESAVAISYTSFHDPYIGMTETGNCEIEHYVYQCCGAAPLMAAPAPAPATATNNTKQLKQIHRLIIYQLYFLS